MYECNWGGEMSAILCITRSWRYYRTSCCVGYGVVILAILFTDRVDSLRIRLGKVMVVMVTLFLVVVIELRLDVWRFAKRLLPISIPLWSVNIVLDLIGTTSIGSNLFLGFLQWPKVSPVRDRLLNRHCIDCLCTDP